MQENHADYVLSWLSNPILTGPRYFLWSRLWFHWHKCNQATKFRSTWNWILDHARLVGEDGCQLPLASNRSMKILASCQIAIHRKNSVLTSRRKLEHFAISSVFAMDPCPRVGVLPSATSCLLAVALASSVRAMITRGTIAFNLEHIPKNPDSRENRLRTGVGRFPKLISRYRPSATGSTYLRECHVVANLTISRNHFTKEKRRDGEDASVGKL